MTEDDEFEERLHRLKFYVKRNICYHMRRTAFFVRWSRVTSFVGVVFGSAAAATLLSPLPTMVAAALALLVAVVSAFDLVVGTGQLAGLHNDLRRRYLTIAVKAELYGPGDEYKILEAFAEMKGIESDEPPTLPALELLAYEDAVRSMYNGTEVPQYVTRLGWLKRLTANWFYWDTSKA